MRLQTRKVGQQIDMKLPSVADLFTTQEQRDEDKRENVREIPLTEISDFPNHPFKVKTDEELFDTMEMEDCTPSHAQAIKLRRFAETGKLNQEVILSIMMEEKPNQAEQFKMPKKRIEKYFPEGTPSKEMENTIIKALEMYRKRERNRERER